MKKIFLICSAIILSCFIISNVILPVTSSGNDKAPVTNPSVSSQKDDYMYLITSLDGKIVVYKQGVSNPYLKTDTVVKYLPQQDREDIEKGVYIKGEINLKKALEDYCS